MIEFLCRFLYLRFELIDANTASLREECTTERGCKDQAVENIRNNQCYNQKT